MRQLDRNNPKSRIASRRLLFAILLLVSFAALACGLPSVDEVTHKFSIQFGIFGANNWANVKFANELKAYRYENVREVCGPNAMSCLRYDVIVVPFTTEEYECQVAFHESIHYILYKTTGNYDASHLTPVFNDDTISKWCQPLHKSGNQ